MITFSATIILNMSCMAGEPSLVMHYEMRVDNAGGIADCLVCHDNIIAKMGSFQLHRLGNSPNPLASHPVDVPYPAEWSGKSGFTPEADLTTAGLRLRDGKVVCTTCHDLRLQSKYFLAITQESSKLCYACHKL